MWYLTVKVIRYISRGDQTSHQMKKIILYSILGTRTWLITLHELMVYSSPLVTKLIFRKNLSFIKLQIIGALSDALSDAQMNILSLMTEKLGILEKVRFIFKHFFDEWNIYFAEAQINYQSPFTSGITHFNALFTHFLIIYLLRTAEKYAVAHCTEKNIWYLLL